MAADQLDVLIIGSGPGGYRAAVLAAQRGLRTGVVERGTWGGTCLNRGCVPKKAWHHSAQQVADARGHARRGLAGEIRGDLNRAWLHQREVVQAVRSGYVDYLARLGVQRLEGGARFADPHTVCIGDKDTVECRHVIIATGSCPIFPSALPFVPERMISTDELFDNPPPAGDDVAVCGSGVIGAEFAFILAMLGKRVTWICRGEPLSHARFSAPARRALMDQLAAHGVAPRIGARVVQTAITGERVALTLEDGATLAADWVLVAAGRRPNSDALGLENAGVETDADGFICVDAHQRCAAPHIFAIGDVASREMSANQALAQAAVAVENILTPGASKHAAVAVPFVVYSAAVLARLGLTEDELEAQEREPAIGYAAFEANPRALGQNDSAGFVRLVADHDTGELHGAEIVGREAGELINLIGGVFQHPNALSRLARLPYNHPSRAEEIQNAVEALATRWGLMEQIFGPLRGPA